MAGTGYKETPDGPTPQQVRYRRKQFEDEDKALLKEERKWDSLDAAVRLVVKNPEDQVIGQEQLQELHDIIDLLPPLDAEIFTAFFERDEPVEQIARVTGKTRDNIIRRLGNTRLRLASWFRSYNLPEEE